MIKKASPPIEQTIAKIISAAGDRPGCGACRWETFLNQQHEQEQHGVREEKRSVC